ncbi:TIGR04283 family arsenosugar biosynthesis glycosyltransferase [Leptolyngbya sp. FACHB-36]|uniref:TIGR04283 family arsenosugar biosynthesis glycosyltransferase n=1 Tax=Leptolyngbya sp. FACHB-36 TaxID=2692808 RepID=UPI0016800F73|nr:TIGR04283 family arsenosugar biosynthesis glycosyltransferase [Leptolyngbya sp. FACHB-36]MBD2020925.1 TIGR04283 family arsenosugar biosynthesis glycosyltransferase [Leptolyngbya sp. FACHB-36]
MLEQLIIFTRYPKPGTAKTRLIPALGAEGAADLHRQMTQHTLAQARSLRSARSITIEIRFTGGDAADMRAWLGDDISYEPQGEGDLGDRLTRAFDAALNQGSQSVVVVGTDCPYLDAALLDTAFDALQQRDLALGPAEDGGYYLIGLRKLVPELFVEIPWSTAEVWQRTVAIAQRLGLSLDLDGLPTLSDVDYPQDLPTWEQAQRKISVIIPTLNEVKILAKTLRSVQHSSNVEIVVADGGSHDETIAIAQAQGVRVVRASPGRAIQMNAGARVASGEILLFLHSDTHLPKGFDRRIRQTLNHPSVIVGAFELAISGTVAGLRLVEWGVNVRSRRLQLPYGDQGIFLRAETFRKLGGFPELPIMEDFELVCRLRRLGRVAIVPAAVLTSGRRWQKLGVLKTTLINQLAIAAYLLGVSPDRIARWYRDK